jgi:hypothetical protein
LVSAVYERVIEEDAQHASSTGKYVRMTRTKYSLVCQ